MRKSSPFDVMVQDTLYVSGHENALPMATAHGAATPAKSESKDVIKAEPESAQQASSSGTPQRRALQALDSNRLSNTPQSAAAEAPESLSKPVFVSPLARLLTERKICISQYAPSPGSAAGITALSGQKRKPQSSEDAGSRKSDLASVTVTEDEKDVELATATDENIAWLDMLVALLERKYRGRSLPVDVSTLQRADLLEQASQLSTSGTASSLSQQVSEEPNANRIFTDQAIRNSRDLPSQPASQKMDAMSAAPSVKTKEQLEQLDKEREELRQRQLLLHAQQIQDTSVTSTACCGCKTGCLKMYVHCSNLCFEIAVAHSAMVDACRYCVCFSTRGFCHPQCTCDDCKNSRENKQQRLEAIQSYLSNDPRAFSLSSFQLKARTTGFLHLLPQVMLPYQQLCSSKGLQATHSRLRGLAESQHDCAARLPVQEVQVPQEILRVFSERTRVHSALPLPGLLEPCALGALHPQEAGTGRASREAGSVPPDPGHRHQEAQA